jgi:hypothetical protein
VVTPGVGDGWVNRSELSVIWCVGKVDHWGRLVRSREGGRECLIGRYLATSVCLNVVGNPLQQQQKTI